MSQPANPFRGEASLPLAGSPRLLRPSFAALVAADAQRAAVGAWLAGQADMPALLHRLTQLLPDTAYLNRFDAEGRRVRITGSAADGAGLMDLLRAEPQVEELRALSPIVREKNGTRLPPLS